mgnify:CR=1 FL=1
MKLKKLFAILIFLILCNTTLYAETKISMEDYIKTSCDDKIPYVILRPSSVHGPSPRMRFDLTVNHFVKDAVLDKKLEIYGGNLWRPLMWVGEVGRASREELFGEARDLDRSRLRGEGLLPQPLSALHRRQGVRVPPEPAARGRAP